MLGHTFVDRRESLLGPTLVRQRDFLGYALVDRREVWLGAELFGR